MKMKLTFDLQCPKCRDHGASFHFELRGDVFYAICLCCEEVVFKVPVYMLEEVEEEDETEHE